MAPQPPAPSRSFVLFHSSTFFFFFFLKHGLICRAASATLCLVCLHCVRRSLLLAVCVCLGKHVMGIAANPSRGVTLKCFSPGALRRCGIRWKGSTSCLCGQVPGRGGQSPYWPRWIEHTTHGRHYLFHHGPGRRRSGPSSWEGGCLC